MLTTELIRGAYETLMAAKREYTAAVVAEVDAERALEDARLRAIGDGRIVGKNEMERAVSGQPFLAELIDAHRRAQDRARAARLEVEVAALEVEMLRTELRLLELGAGATG